ncbi:ATP-binding protein [Streptomyces sp. NPDC016845]|uniref:ATP-binding protein n=1 Tax=Streptomyces sp. NPDC016845 TaxID=3364972 RepID=UPI0037B79B85
MALTGDADGGCIAEARRFAADFLTRARSTHLVGVSRRAVEVTQLVVSELVTNACRFAPGPVLLDLTLLADTLRVEVWDCDPVLPLTPAADTGPAGRHGLRVVLIYVQSFEARREPVGKCVTVTLTLARDPGAAPGGPTPVRQPPLRQGSVARAGRLVRQASWRLRAWWSSGAPGSGCPR